MYLYVYILIWLSETSVSPAMVDQKEHVKINQIVCAVRSTNTATSGHKAR